MRRISYERYPLMFAVLVLTKKLNSAMLIAKSLAHFPIQNSMILLPRYFFKFTTF
jgi:hypothetical protein